MLSVTKYGMSYIEVDFFTENFIEYKFQAIWVFEMAINYPFLYKFKSKKNKLITESIELWGLFGIVILFVFHIWMDYVWLYIVAFFASKTTNFLSNRNYKILIISLTIALIYFEVIPRSFSERLLNNSTVVNSNIDNTTKHVAIHKITGLISCRIPAHICFGMVN